MKVSPKYLVIGASAVAMLLVSACADTEVTPTATAFPTMPSTPFATSTTMPMTTTTPETTTPETTTPATATPTTASALETPATGVTSPAEGDAGM